MAGYRVLEHCSNPPCNTAICWVLISKLFKFSPSMVVSSGAPESPPQVPPGIYLLNKFMMLKYQVPKLYAKQNLCMKSQCNRNFDLLHLFQPITEQLCNFSWSVIGWTSCRRLKFLLQFYLSGLVCHHQFNHSNTLQYLKPKCDNVKIS